MAEKELGITAKADVDSAISDLQNLIDKLGDMPDTTSTTVEVLVNDAALVGLNTEMSNISDKNIDLSVIVNDTALDTLQAEIGTIDTTLDYTVNVDSTGLDQLGADADAAATEVSSIGDAATDASADIASIDDTAINEAASAATSLGDNLEGAATGAGDFNTEISESGDHISALSAGLQGVVALGLGTFFATAIEGAGSFNDTWSRLAVVMGEGGLPIEQVKDEWSDAISSMQDTTGRGAGSIRQYIISMGLAGVTSKDSIISSFSGVAGAAYITGYSIDSITSAFRRVVATGTLGNRQLMALGLSEQDIMKATGLSVEQVSEKLQGMDANQRAAFLGMIMNSKYGVDANNAYKQSWQYVLDVLSRTWDYLSRVIGGLILPVVIPALEAVSWVLQQVADWIGKLDGPLKTVMSVVVAGVGGWILLSTVLTTITGIINMLGISLGLTTARQVASTIAQHANTAARWLGIGSYNAEIGAAAAHATAIGGSTAATDLNTAATNTGIAARLRDIGTWVSGAAVRVAQALATAAATAAQIAYSVAAGVATGAQWLLNAALSANPIGIVVLAIVALIGALIWLYQNNEWVRNGVNWLWQGLQGFAAWIMSGLTPILNFFNNLLRDPIGTLQQVLLAFSNFHIMVGQYLLAAGQNALNTITAWFGQIPTWIWNFLLQTLVNILNFNNQLGLYILGAGQNTINTIIAWFGQIPGIIWNFLLQTLVNFLNFNNQAAQYALDAGSSVLNNIISFISGLPGAVWDWFIKTLDKISSFAVEAYNRAKKTGENIFNGIIDFVKSIPGQMYTYGQNILQSLIDGLKDKMGPFKDILNYISDHWPKSPPKTGPLSEITPEGMRSWMGGIVDAGMDTVANFNLNGINPVPNIGGANLPGRSMTNNSNSINVNVSLDGANINSNLDAKKLGETAGSAAGDALANKLEKQARNRGYLTINNRR
jgi:transcriptional regulator with XRE-family HTH domain